RRRAVALVPEADAPAREIVRRHLDDHAVADAGADAELPHLSSGVGEDLMIIVELDPEMPVREHLGHHAVELEHLFLRHVSYPLEGQSYTSPPRTAIVARLRRG